MSGTVPDREAYVEAVLRAVESIPAGRAASYGDLAEYVGGGGPRQVGAVMSHYGGTVCWWRVVRADGRPARGHETEALRRLQDEGAPIHGDRVALNRCRWTGSVVRDGNGAADDNPTNSQAGVTKRQQSVSG